MSVVVWWRRTVSTIKVLVLAAAPIPVAAQNGVQRDAQAIFAEAHTKLGGGANFTDATCATAIPMLDEAIVVAGTQTGDSAITTRSFAMLERGYCKLVARDPAGAVTLFQSVVETGSRGTGNAGIIGPARACLARAYAEGEGVAVDQVRALGLFVLSEGSHCNAVSYDPAGRAADIVLGLDGYAADRAEGLAYHFLKLGTSADWLRAVTLYEAGAGRNTGMSGELVQMAMRGLEAGGDTPQDRAARVALDLKLGDWHLARSSPAVALGYFFSADSAEATTRITRVLEDAPFRLSIGAVQGHEAPGVR